MYKGQIELFSLDSLFFYLMHFTEVNFRRRLRWELHKIYHKKSLKSQNLTQSRITLANAEFFDRK